MICDATPPGLQLFSKKTRKHFLGEDLIHHIGLRAPPGMTGDHGDQFSPGREQRSHKGLFGAQRQGVPCRRGDSLTTEGPVEELTRGPGLELVRDV